MTVFKSESIVADIFSALMTRNAIRESQNKLNDVLQLFGQWTVSQQIPPIADKRLLATIKLTKQECAQMDATFQKVIRTTGYVARVAKWCEQNKVFYEIRYRRNGWNISTMSTDLLDCKQKFIQATYLNNTTTA